MRSSVDAYGQTTVMVTHDPHAAAIADRILFSRTGGSFATSALRSR
jgi:putative ABC transport system ATP-binding protein